MENPCSAVAELIHQTLIDHAKALSQGFCGVSREMAIYSALKRAGYLFEEAQECLPRPRLVTVLELAEWLENKGVAGRLRTDLYTPVDLALFLMEAFDIYTYEKLQLPKPYCPSCILGEMHLICRAESG